MGDEVLCLGKLNSLKQLKSEQRLLSRCQFRLEQAYSQHSDHCDSVERCTLEVHRLREEREELARRLHEIDSDIQKLNELSTQLSCEATLRALSAPLDDYSQTLDKVNTTRRTLGMEQLVRCRTYSHLIQLQQNLPEHTTDPLLPGKAGRARKSCPHCFKVVSRNAITCPGCSSVCSKKRVISKGTRDQQK